MTKKIVGSYLGVNEYVHIDPMKPGDMTVEETQDCQEVLDFVKECRDRPVGKEWRHVASVPLIFYNKAAREGWLHDRKKWWAFLNDPDNAAFRVWNGRIGPTKQI